MANISFFISKTFSSFCTQLFNHVSVFFFQSRLNKFHSLNFSTPLTFPRSMCQDFNHMYTFSKSLPNQGSMPYQLIRVNPSSPSQGTRLGICDIHRLPGPFLEIPIPGIWGGERVQNSPRFNRCSLGFLLHIWGQLKPMLRISR